MVGVAGIEDYCIGLLDTDKRVRQNSATALKELGKEAIQLLERIVIFQQQTTQKDWSLLVGAISTLNLHGISEDSRVVTYQKHLRWLPEDRGRYDLHLHSELSDGTQTVDEVMRGAVSACVKVISLCDHNTMDGVRLAQSLCHEYGIRVIPGCEFSTHMNLGEQEWIEVHIAGYFLNPDSAEVQDLFMSTQRKIQLRDILIANDFLIETADNFESRFGIRKDVLDIIIEANRYYAEILSRNGLDEKSKHVSSVMCDVESNRGTIHNKLDTLIGNASASKRSYQYSVEEEDLLRKLVLFSGYMIDHAMNTYYTQFVGKEFTGGNWFSEIKKRQEKYAHCLPKVDPEAVISRIYELGGIPVLSHPTWYPVLLLQKSRRKLKEYTGQEPTETEEAQLRERALAKGTEIVRRIHALMPNGLQVMELYHWSYDVEFDLEPHFRELASELGASLSTASDFHGPKKYGEHRSRIGTGVDFNILGTYNQVQALERLKRNV